MFQVYEHLLAFVKRFGGRVVDGSVGRRPRRRQARGERRVELLLDAAAQVFAEVGFEGATTNAIAARAGVSPGTLYQFFSNKDALAEALAARYRERLRATREDAFSPEVAALPLDEMVDRVVDPLIAFQVANPELRALWAGSDVSPRLAAVMQEFHEAVVERVERILAVRAPRLPPDKIKRCARVGVQLVRALLPLVAASDADERAAMIAELKAVQRGYLTSILDTANADRRGG